MLNPETQYANDSNLRARQRLWEFRTDDFDLFAWVLGMAGPIGPAGRRLISGEIQSVTYRHQKGMSQPDITSGKWDLPYPAAAC